MNNVHRKSNGTQWLLVVVAAVALVGMIVATVIGINLAGSRRNVSGEKFASGIVAQASNSLEASLVPLPKSNTDVIDSSPVLHSGFRSNDTPAVTSSIKLSTEGTSPQGDGVKSSSESQGLPSLAQWDPNSPISVGSESSSIAYAWKENEPINYEFSVKMQNKNSPFEIFGRTKLTATNKSVDAKDFESAVGSGSGTGFVIHPDGVLVTCEHVVKNANKIRVNLDGKSFDAKVIALDAKHDLALLRINAKSLPFLRIINFDQVKLAEEIRVVGFPLSHILGETVKVSRGEVSGIDRNENGSVLQIDASVNPGNSGGPIINNRGDVVGVVSELLVGQGISEVGLGIPSSDVSRFLLQNHIPFMTEPNVDNLKSTDLISKVTPSVAFLQVDYGANGVGIQSPRVIDFFGFWSEMPDRNTVRPRSPATESDSSKFVADRFGQILSVESKLYLPYMLGSATSIGIEHLPNEPGGHTVSTRPIVLQRIEQQDALPGLSGYGLRLPRGRSGLPGLTEQKVTLLPGIEKTAVELGLLNGDFVDVKKTYEMLIPGKSKNDIPYAQVEGTGTGKFNVLIGQMESMEFKVKVLVEREGIAIQIPVVLNYKRRDPVLVAKEEAEIRAKNQPSSAPMIQSTPSSRSSNGLGFSGSVTGGTGKAVEKQAPSSGGLQNFDPDK